MDGPVDMNYNVLLKLPLLELYTYSQSSRSGKYAVEFYGKERHTTATNSAINGDKNMRILIITLNDDQQFAAID